jgi:hypothetical protein
MAGSVVWHGAQDEWLLLTRSVERHCVCERVAYRPTPVCASHRLLTEQAALDRLLFTRAIAARLRREELLWPDRTAPSAIGPDVETGARS